MSLDPRIWKAIAGAGKIPAVGSLVYYFPQGHAEQASSAPNFSSVSISNPYCLCRVAAVRLLANPDTDEVFAKISLDPLPSAAAATLSHQSQNRSFDGFGQDLVAQEAVSFVKTLTPSDANNGGGFSVPRFCADSILPELNFTVEPPVQNISICDVHGNSWDFRHIYRGTPRRHLLTTGWSRFVNSKKLIAGDSVVFIRDNIDKKLFVGIRRRSCGNPDQLKWDVGKRVGIKDGFSRNVKGRVPAESIVEAVRSMESGCEFEVLYYPRARAAEFVVDKEVVERAVGFYWSEGMRVKMSVETEDSARMTWFHGMVRRADAKDSGPWSRSPWRMLQVTWDEHDVLQNVRAVSPWQVELMPTTPHMQAPFPAMKKLKVPQVLELSTEGHGDLLFPQSDTNSMQMGNPSPPYNFHTFPAGMQGARHEFFVPSWSSFLQRTHQMFANNIYGINTPEDMNTSHSEAASPPSQENSHDHSLELVGVAACNTGKAIKEFQLFGKIIQMNQPDDDSVGDYAENEGVQSLEFSLSFPHKQLLDGVDVQHPRISAVETCSL